MAQPADLAKRIVDALFDLIEAGGCRGLVRSQAEQRVAEVIAATRGDAQPDRPFGWPSPAAAAAAYLKMERKDALKARILSTSGPLDAPTYVVAAPQITSADLAEMLKPGSIQWFDITATELKARQAKPPQLAGDCQSERPTPAKDHLAEFRISTRHAEKFVADYQKAVDLKLLSAFTGAADDTD